MIVIKLKNGSIIKINYAVEAEIVPATLRVHKGPYARSDGLDCLIAFPLTEVIEYFSDKNIYYEPDLPEENSPDAKS